MHRFPVKPQDGCHLKDGLVSYCGIVMWYCSVGNAVLHCVGKRALACRGGWMVPYAALRPTRKKRRIRIRSTGVWCAQPVVWWSRGAGGT